MAGETVVDTAPMAITTTIGPSSWSAVSTPRLIALDAALDDPSEQPGRPQEEDDDHEPEQDGGQ